MLRLLKGTFRDLFLAQRSLYDLCNPTDDLLAFHYRWIKLLKTYTCSELTRHEDKLVAVHDVILRIQQRTNLTNVAGLWQEILPAELLWHTEYPRMKHNTEEHRAPSWSWAVLDTRVTNSWGQLVQNIYRDLMLSYKLDWKITVIEVQATTQVNGQVSRAHLRLQGPLRKVRWGENEGEGRVKDSCSGDDRWQMADYPGHTNGEEVLALLIVRGTGSILGLGARTSFTKMQ